MEREVPLFGKSMFVEMPEGSFRRFKEGLGTIHPNVSFMKDAPYCNHPIIAVGDVTCMNLWNLHEKCDVPMPMLMVFDGTNRRTEFSEFYDTFIKNKNDELWFEVCNPAGGLSEYVHSTVGTALNRGVHYIHVVGEEDLLTLSCIIQCPYDGAHVLYGIPDKGVCCVEVNEESKKHAIALIRSMKCDVWNRDGSRTGGIVGVAGTFNTIHEGHRALLDKAFSLGKYVSIGLTIDSFALETREDVVPFDVRVNRLKAYLRDEMGYNNIDDYRIVGIRTADGGIGYDCSVSSVVVSEETCDTMLRLNADFNFPKEIIEVPLVLDDNGEKVSASKILGYRKKN